MTEGKASRFDYVQNDAEAEEMRSVFKAAFKNMETLMTSLPEGRSKSLVLTKLEEAYMWIGKAIRDDQINRQGCAPLQEDRTNT